MKELKPGRIYSYITQRGNRGRGRLVELVKKTNGMWAIIEDKARSRTVEVRPSQIDH